MRPGTGLLPQPRQLPRSLPPPPAPKPAATAGLCSLCPHSSFPLPVDSAQMRPMSMPALKPHRKSSSQFPTWGALLSGLFALGLTHQTGSPVAAQLMINVQQINPMQNHPLLGQTQCHRGFHTSDS